MSKSYSSRTLTTARVVALALTVSAVSAATAAAATPVAGKSGNEAARVDSFVAPNGAGYFALSLPPVTAPASAGHDVVILFDTSAGQTGAYREKALDALAGFLQTAGDHDRLQLMAVDLNAIPLTEGFVAPRGEAMNAAVVEIAGPRAVGRHRHGRRAR